MDNLQRLERIEMMGKAGKRAAAQGDLFGAGICVGTIRALASGHPRCRLQANEAVETIRWFRDNAWKLELGIAPSRNEQFRTRVRKPFTESELWPHGQESETPPGEQPSHNGVRRRRGRAAP